MSAAPGFRLGQLTGLSRICARHAHSGRPRKATTGFQGPDGHGEKIWVFCHRRTDQVIYSFKAWLDGFHDLKQLPFNGKKTKPAKLRKDYWSPMAVIEFPAGQGSVGRSVFQKLRELRHLHEVSWPEELRYKRPADYTAEDKKRIEEKQQQGIDYRPLISKKERGIVLNAQKQNSIADMAVVLAGQGRGNKMVASELAREGTEKELVEVTVSWSNDQDREYAEEWSKNVTHEVFDEPSYVGKVEEVAVPEEPKPETQPEQQASPA